jgi:hypothetical protein
VYGVTMQEPGVSSIVSVRMRGAIIDDMPLADAVPAVSARAPSAPADTVAAPA